MIDTSALRGGAEACAFSSPEQQDQLDLLGDLDLQIGQAGSPALAYHLVLARQALEARVRYRRWLAECAAARIANDDPSPHDEARTARSHFLLRRAQAAILQ